MLNHRLRNGLGVFCGILALGGQLCLADVTYNVSLVTTSLTNSPASPFYIAFQLTDNSGGPGLSNNTATVTGFSFGAGGSWGPAAPVLTNGASGNLSNSVVLVDYDSNNRFFQQFTPGGSLNFTLQISTQVDSPNPDAFAFSIYYGTDPEPPAIPTFGVANELFAVYIDSADPSHFEYPSDSSFAPNIDIGPPIVTPVPEPGAYPLLLAGFGLLLAARRGR